LISIFSFYYSDVTTLVKDYKSIFITNCYTGTRQKNAAVWWDGRIESGTEKIVFGR